jgi:hypothetical protein
MMGHDEAKIIVVPAEAPAFDSHTGYSRFVGVMVTSQIVYLV